MAIQRKTLIWMVVASVAVLGITAAVIGWRLSQPKDTTPDFSLAADNCCHEWGNCCDDPGSTDGCTRSWKQGYNACVEKKCSSCGGTTDGGDDSGPPENPNEGNDCTASSSGCGAAGQGCCVAGNCGYYCNSGVIRVGASQQGQGSCSCIAPNPSDGGSTDGGVTTPEEPPEGYDHCILICHWKDPDCGTYVSPVSCDTVPGECEQVDACPPDETAGGEDCVAVTVDDCEPEEGGGSTPADSGCGDGTIDPGEQCDPPGQPSSRCDYNAVCSSNCTCPEITDPTILKTASEECAPDSDISTITYTVRAYNPTSSTLTTEITDTLDSAVEDSYVDIDSISDGGVFSDGQITWTGVQIEADGQKALTYDVVFPDSAFGVEYENIVRLRVDGSIVDSARATITPTCETDLPETAIIDDWTDTLIISLGLMFIAAVVLKFDIFTYLNPDYYAQKSIAKSRERFEKTVKKN